MPLTLPTNTYAQSVTERDALLAIHEDLRAIRYALAVLMLFGVPLMVLAFAKLLAA